MADGLVGRAFTYFPRPISNGTGGGGRDAQAAEIYCRAGRREAAFAAMAAARPLLRTSPTIYPATRATGIGKAIAVYV